LLLGTVPLWLLLLTLLRRTRRRLDRAAMDGWQFMTRSLSVPPHSQALTPCQSASWINRIHARKTLPRRVVNALAARLRVMPAVVLTGARQTAKSTLVERLFQGGRRYRTLDDFDVLDAARRDPEALLGGDPLTLDEVQREPGLMSAVNGPSTATAVPGASCTTARPTCC
jgi:hypothetical protein